MIKISFVIAAILFLAGCWDNRDRPITGELPVQVEAPVRTAPRRSEIPQPSPGTQKQTVSDGNDRPAARSSRYETKFDTGDTARATNIALAAEAINGTVVAPGEEFSFNDTVGSTTAERGYKEAVVFRGGEKDKNFGGGVCQVSTTLCNAAHSAGMKITERHDHSLPVLYVGNGIEAATSQCGGLDFKFVNDKNHPVRISANAENGVIWAAIEGV